MNRKWSTKNFGLTVLLLVILFYIVRASTRSGDFIGYINVGILTINNQDIYSDYLNTWPPFFSVFCVPLSLLDGWSSFGVRFLWLILSVLAMFWLMRITVQWVFNKKLLLPFISVKENCITFTNVLIFIPFLIMFRYLLDNLANVQINIFLLLTCILSIQLFIKGRQLLAGLILGLSISLKVFPIFLLFYFIFKREYKIVGWTFLSLFLYNSIPLIVFGTEQGFYYYAHWWNEIASPYPSVQHKNQSFFSLLRSLMTNETPGLDIYLNVIDLPIKTLKKVAYLILIIGGLFPMYLFRNKLTNKKDSFAILEYIFVLTAIPILSPLAWKAYFIFLWPGYLLAYYYLFYKTNKIEGKNIKVLKLLFSVSVFLNVVSTDLFLGAYYADVMEVFSSITIGTLILMAVLLWIYYLKLTATKGELAGEHDISFQ